MSSIQKEEKNSSNYKNNQEKNSVLKTSPPKIFFHSEKREMDQLREALAKEKKEKEELQRRLRSYGTENEKKLQQVTHRLLDTPGLENDEIIHFYENKIQCLDNDSQRLMRIFDASTASDDEFRETIAALLNTNATLLNTKRALLKELVILKNHTRELEQRNRELEVQSALLGHDLRSPLAPVITLLELIHENANPQEKIELFEEFYEEIRTRVNTIFHLTDLLMGKGTISRQRMKMNRIYSLLNNQYADYPLPGIQLKGKDIQIFCDEVAIRNVLQNLMNNSIKHSGKKGKELQIEIQAEYLKETTQTIIRFVDNGRGVPEKQQEDIFLLYNQGGKIDSSGKGLGLFFARHVLEQHQGTIEYSSSSRQGACFVLKIPNSSE